MNVTLSRHWLLRAAELCVLGAWVARHRRYAPDHALVASTLAFIWLLTAAASLAHVQSARRAGSHWPPALAKWFSGPAPRATIAAEAHTLALWRITEPRRWCSRRRRQLSLSREPQQRRRTRLWATRPSQTTRRSTARAALPRRTRPPRALSMSLASYSRASQSSSTQVCVLRQGEASQAARCAALGHYLCVLVLCTRVQATFRACCSCVTR